MFFLNYILSFYSYINSDRLGSESSALKSPIRRNFVVFSIFIKCIFHYLIDQRNIYPANLADASIQKVVISNIVNLFLQKYYLYHEVNSQI